MKITFVEAPTPWSITQHAQIPLGILYLATILRNAGYDASIFRPSTVQECRLVFDSDVLAFGGTTLEYPMVAECAKLVRKEAPMVKIWLGGIHATSLPDEVLSTGLFDSIGLGEAEPYILRMAEDYSQSKPQHIYSSAEPIKNLDEIPIPDRSLIQGVHGRSIFSFGENFKGSGSENVISSRGCPFSCAFCSSKIMCGCGVRFRSVKNMIDEIRYIVDKFGCRQLRFADDNITSKRGRLLDLCSEMSGLDVAWKCSARAATLTEPVCEALVASGCKEVSVGIENGDQRVLDFLNKQTTLESMRVGCNTAAAAGLHVRGLFMIGTPGEMPDTPELTMEFIESTRFHSITLAFFTPLPGSAVFDHPEAFNCEILSRNYSKYNKHFWVYKNGASALNEIGEFLLIDNKFMSLHQQKTNIQRMKQYFENSPLNNKG